MTNRHLNARPLSVPTDIPCANRVAVRRPFGLNDVLSVRIYDNVISRRKKDELAQKTDELRKATNSFEGGQRLGIINDLGSYYRYYDDQGNWKVYEIRGEYENLIRLREDLDRYSSRMRDQASQIEQDYNSALELRDTALATKKKWDEARQRSLADLTNRRGSGALGEGTFEAEFLPGGVFRIRASDDSRWYTGTWSQSGNRVTMRAGASTFEGTIQGDRLSGSRYRRKGTLTERRDSWDLTLQWRTAGTRAVG